MNIIDNTITEESFTLQHSFTIFKNHKGDEVHSVKISMKDVTTKRSILKNTRKIKALPDTHFMKKVFIKSDQPPLTRKENDRLRKKARDLRSQHPGSMVSIQKGTLYKDNVKVDYFDLDNQIF